MIIKFDVEGLKEELAEGLQYAEVEVKTEQIPPSSTYVIYVYVRPPQQFSPVIESLRADALHVRGDGELFEIELKEFIEWLKITKAVARMVDEKCVKLVEVLKEALEKRVKEAVGGK